MRAFTLDFEPWSGDPLPAMPVRPSAIIALLAIWALAFLIFPPVALGTLLLVAGAATVLIAILAYRLPQWRIFALLLIVETLPSANLIPLPEGARPLLRYPLYLLFCAPLLPRVWRSRI